MAAAIELLSEDFVLWSEQTNAMDREVAILMLEKIRPLIDRCTALTGEVSVTGFEPQVFAQVIDELRHNRDESLELQTVMASIKAYLRFL